MKKKKFCTRSPVIAISRLASSITKSLALFCDIKIRKTHWIICSRSPLVSDSRLDSRRKSVVARVTRGS